MKLSLTLFLLIVIIHLIPAQDNDIIIGKPPNTTTAAVYDLSNPEGVNIEVNLWGFVRYPGRYKIPYNTTFLDLISYSGGPTESSNLTDIRIVRNLTDSSKAKTEVIKLNYNDFLWGDKVKINNKFNPVLKSGDVILVLEEKRYTSRENFAFYMPIVVSLITLATFIVTLTK
jgi:protein involved in polysaccharide export with SLBB domain